MIERLELTEKKYNEIQEELMKPEVVSDIKKSRELSIEASNLEDVVNCYHKYKRVLRDLEEAKVMVKEVDLKEFAEEELERLTKEKEELDKELEILLIPKDKNDTKNVIVEIRGAAGGDEGNIFAGDLYRMYEKYALKKGFQIDVLNSIDGASGGFTLIEFMIKGKNVYSFLKYESGSHRVQRVPVTEANGRIQTSTATVLVMPEADDFDIDLKESDIRIDITRSSGAGGQHVNRTESAVRMTHIPTGITVFSQTQRSQIQNRENAYQILKSRVYDYYQSIEEEKAGAERKSKIGTGDRSEKIRTYNYPQNRVTDHRIGFTTKQLDRVMEGELDEIIEALITEDQKRKLEVNSED
ncbi:MAG: peptide chain release factor 1 [Bacilli bacterium]|nr:peptide chain release factor 1 [Bacilli bacterium]